VSTNQVTLTENKFKLKNQRKSFGEILQHNKMKIKLKNMIKQDTIIKNPQFIKKRNDEILID
jgi:hypothetical protein